MYDSGDEHIRLVTYGDINELNNKDMLVRIHSSCLASEIFNALDCDCADQVMESMRLIAENGAGIIIHIHQEGRGHGLSKKIAAVRLMKEQRLDTAESFDVLNLDHDVREYKEAIEMLLEVGINRIRLITNNPRKVEYVERNGIEVIEVVNTYTSVRQENVDYLYSKNIKLFHNIPLDNNSEKIYFHNEELPHGYLSNFSRHSIIIKGIEWSTVEHYYQAHKFEDKIIQEQVRMAPTPRLAKQIANDNKESMVNNWNDIKEEIMYAGLYAKFTQHPGIHRDLLETGKMVLCEHSPHDSYWGDGGDGTGRNRLGVLLMKIREQIRRS